MNIVVAALRKKKPWEVKLQLFKEYGNNPLLVQTFERHGPTYQNKALLDAQLQKLRWKKGLPREETVSEGKQMQQALDESLSVAVEADQEDRLYPKEIEKAFQIRMKAINQRESAGRKLTQFADEMSQEDRAKLFKVQKDQHAIVAAQTRIINTWKKTKKILKEGELTEQEELEKEWQSLKNKMTQYRRRAKKMGDPEFLNEKIRRQDELRIILGKQKRRKST